MPVELTTIVMVMVTVQIHWKIECGINWIDDDVIWNATWEQCKT